MLPPHGEQQTHPHSNPIREFHNDPALSLTLENSCKRLYLFDNQELHLKQILDTKCEQREIIKKE